MDHYRPVAGERRWVCGLPARTCQVFVDEMLLFNGLGALGRPLRGPCARPRSVMPRPISSMAYACRRGSNRCHNDWIAILLPSSEPEGLRLKLIVDVIGAVRV